MKIEIIVGRKGRRAMDPFAYIYCRNRNVEFSFLEGRYMESAMMVISLPLAAAERT